jgi:hypothetical protein
LNTRDFPNVDAASRRYLKLLADPRPQHLSKMPRVIAREKRPIARYFISDPASAGHVGCWLLAVGISTIQGRQQPITNNCLSRLPKHIFHLAQ